MTVAAAILAAGESRRLGRRKQLVEIEGEPLLRRTARIALASRADRVAAVLGAYREEIEPSLAGLAVEVVDNPEWREGMGSSIRAAVAWARGAEFLLLLVCDQPHLATPHLDALIARRALVGSRYAGTIGVPALVPAERFDDLAALRGDRGARGMFVDAIDWEPGSIDLDVD
jgi:CTP:molybdopterin cytidylyltransferase MocA